MTVVFAILTVIAILIAASAASLALVIREKARALASLYREESALPTHVCNTQSLKPLTERKGLASIRSPGRARRRVRIYASSHLPSWVPHH